MFASLGAHAFPILKESGHNFAGQLSVLRTPKGLDLKEAFQRLSSLDLGQSLSPTYHGQASVRMERFSMKLESHARTPLNTPEGPALAGPAEMEKAATENEQTCMPARFLDAASHHSQQDAYGNCASLAKNHNPSMYLENMQQSSQIKDENSAIENTFHKHVGNIVSRRANDQLTFEESMSGKMAAVPQQEGAHLAEGEQLA